MIRKSSAYVLRKRKHMARERRPPAAREAAEILAIQGLTFLAEDPERLGRFLALTGISPQELRNAAREPRFLAGVLTHLAEDESLLAAFAEQAGVDRPTVMRAHAVLAGPAWEREVP
jgi:hypothetical protein